MITCKIYLLYKLISVKARDTVKHRLPTATFFLPIVYAASLWAV